MIVVLWLVVLVLAIGLALLGQRVRALERAARPVTPPVDQGPSPASALSAAADAIERHEYRYHRSSR